MCSRSAERGISWFISLELMFHYITVHGLSALALQWAGTGLWRLLNIVLQLHLLSRSLFAFHHTSEMHNIYWVLSSIAEWFNLLILSLLNSYFLIMMKCGSLKRAFLKHGELHKSICCGLLQIGTQCLLFHVWLSLNSVFKMYKSEYKSKICWQVLKSFIS